MRGRNSRFAVFGLTHPRALYASLVMEQLKKSTTKRAFYETLNGDYYSRYGDLKEASIAM